MMTQNELINLWQSAPNQERIRFEKSRLMIDVQANLDRLEREIKARARMDSMSLWIALPAFAIGAIFVPFLVSKIACVAISLWTIFLIFRLGKTRKNRSRDFTGSYLDYLHMSKKLLVGQQKLMQNALYWTAIPFLIFSLLFFSGFMEGEREPMRQALMLGGGTVVLVIGLHFLNKWVVNHQVTPRLDKVNSLIEMLEQERNTEVKN